MLILSATVFDDRIKCFCIYGEVDVKIFFVFALEIVVLNSSSPLPIVLPLIILKVPLLLTKFFQKNIDCVCILIAFESLHVGYYGDTI